MPVNANDLQHALTDQEIAAFEQAKETALLNRIAELETRVAKLEKK